MMRPLLGRRLLLAPAKAASMPPVSCLRAFALRSFSTSDIQASRLTVQLFGKDSNPDTQRTLKFGHEFTDHMLEVDWNVSKGWGSPRIVPFHDLVLHPAASVLHYGLECFEGLKAYLDSDNKIRMFRPDMNMARMNKSCERLALPTFNGDEYLKCIKELIKIDKKWIPHRPNYSLYIRPTMISTTKQLGVAPPTDCKLYTILSPVGPYYPEGFNPVKLYADIQHVRAWPGGFGFAKCGGNYAGSIMPQQRAAKLGYSQILWLFGKEHYVTEVGTMNMMVFWINEDGKRELVTPPLDDGTILAGVTRDSILALCRQWNEFIVSERRFTIHDVIKALKEDRVIEAFGCGTAAIVSPVKGIYFNGTEHAVPLDKSSPSALAGKLTKRLVDYIQGIQYGKIPHEWSVLVE